MIVHRLLDAVFRTLDTVDAIRARVDAVLGRADAQPPSAWPAVIDDDNGAIDSASVRSVYSPDDQRLNQWTQDQHDVDGDVAGDASKPAPAPSQKVTAKKTTAKKPTATKTAKAATKTTATNTPGKRKAKKTTAKKAAASTTTTMASRKGSVDRHGKDLDSARAREVAAFIEKSGSRIIDEEAALDGKRTLARVLWAVAIAEQSGSSAGLTAVDASALLSTVANVEVFSTNVARAFRDEHALFTETTPDGRSKRYTLTAAGRARLGEVTLR